MCVDSPKTKTYRKLTLSKMSPNFQDFLVSCIGTEETVSWHLPQQKCCRAQKILHYHEKVGWDKWNDKKSSVNDPKIS